MADFGAIFDKAKADAETKIQGYRDTDQRNRETQDKAFAEKMKPLNDVVRPVIESAKASLANRDVEVKIDHEEFYNKLDGRRIPAVHFQILYNDLRSKIYTFQLMNQQFSCSADNGEKKPWGQRMGVFATDSGNVTPAMVEEAISRAINDIMQAMEQAEFRRIFPSAT